MNGRKGSMNLRSSILNKLLFFSRSKIPAIFDNSILPVCFNICGRTITRTVRRLNDRCAIVSWLWEKSFSRKISRKMQAMFLEVRFSPGLPWQRLLESFILLLISLMPVLNSWWYLLPLLILTSLTSAKETDAQTQRGKKIFSGAGLWLFWTAIVVSAVFSGGFKTGLFNIFQWSAWLSMSWLVYLSFSKEFCKKVLKYIVLTSLIWLAAGFAQLYAGLPTPTGWLGAGQSAIINIRVYSVFGNPNIYGLYLLSVLILSGFLMDRRTPLHCRCWKFCFISAAGLTLGALYFTYSRTVWMIAGVIIFIWAWRKCGNTRPLSSLFLSLLILAVLFRLPGFRVRMENALKFSDSSFWYRIRIWEGVVQALKDFWIWGIGPAKFQIVYPAYQIGKTFAQHAHELYLQLWLENGVISLIAFGRFIKKLLTGFRFPGDPYLGPLVIIIIVFLMDGLFESWWINRFCGGYFWLLAGLLMSLKNKGPAVS